MNADGYVTIGTMIDTKEFDSQMKYIESKMLDIEDKLKQADMGFEVGDTQKLEAEYERLGNQLIGLKEKQEKYNQSIKDIAMADFNKTKKSLEDIGRSVEKVTKKVGRWALAVLSIRSAYLFVRQAMSTLSEYNDDLANKISNIRLVLATALEPIINRIISLVITLLNYLNYLTTAWFGLNLFARASELTTEKMAKDLASGAGSAKEIKKQLAGFDEMNVLNDNSNSGGGGGAGGNVKTPEFDLPSAKIPEWIKWLADHGDLVRKIVEGIAAALLMIKSHLSLIQGLGIFLIIDGVVNLIKDLKTYLEDKTWENFAVVLRDISEILLGFSLLTGITTPLGIILAVLSQIVTIVSGLPGWISSIVQLIKEPSWDNFKRTIEDSLKTLGPIGTVIKWVLDKLGLLDVEIKNTTEAQINLKQATENLTSAQDIYVNSVDRAEEAQRKLNEIQEKTGISGEDLFNKVKQGVLDYKDMTAEQREVYKAYLNNEDAQNNLKDATDKLTEAKKQEKIASLESQLAVAKETGNFDAYKKAVVEAFEKGEISSDEARELIGKAMSGMSEDSKKTFTKDLPDNVKKGLDTKQYDKPAKDLKNGLLGVFSNMGTDVGQVLGGAISGALKSVVNAIMWYIENKINTMVNNINSFISLINKIPGVNIGKLSRVSLPRLAKGGIINMPGRGVPVGSAIAGERGREAVLPLTDSQQMQMLGEAIGKYITINANITNTMNGRVISRELQKINNESDFAFNR